MPIPPKRFETPYHHGDLHASLRRAAWDVVGDVGARGVTLRECARRAGVSHAAPAHHFGSLAGLLDEVAADGFERMNAVIDKTLASSEHPVLACGLGYVRFATTWPQHFRLMLGTDIVESSSLRLREASGAVLQRLRDVLRDVWVARHGSEPTAAVLDERAALGWSAAHGYASLAIEHRTVNLALPPARKVFAPILEALLVP
jgi:AcrR family transcriptional regulator